MTTTPPAAPSGSAPQPGDSGPRVSREEVRDLRRLRRTVVDRHIAGVAGGLGRHLDIDPVILRVAFVVLSFFGGAGLLLYAACWLLVPEDGATEAPLHLDDRSRVAALAIAAALAGLVLLGDSWGVVGFPWPLMILGAVVLVVLSQRSSSKPPAPWVPSAPAGAPPSDAGASTPYPAPATPYSGSVPPYAGAPTPYPGPATPYAGPVPPYAGSVPPPVAPRPRRHRGPILFWFTMALATLGLGVLGVVDQAGADVPAAAYPAVVVAACGLMLLVGSFWGRAGGLILVGLLAAGAMGLTTAADKVDGSVTTERPTSAAAVASSYDINAGELELDLTEVDDLDALDGRTVRLHNNAGEIKVLVPEGIDVEVTADIHGVGGIDVFGEESGGVDVRDRAFHDSGAADAPRLDLEIEVNVGQITVESR